MNLYKIAATAAERIAMRALAGIVLAIFVVVAIYHFTVAGTIALEIHFGEMRAQLIVAGIYSVAAAVTLAILWATTRKAPAPVEVPRETKLAMLIEAAVLGFTLAKKSTRSR